MMTMMNTNDILIAFVSYSMGNKGKRRPVLLLEQNGWYLKAFRITSKFAQKSPAIQKEYFEIVDWTSANLRKPSWIDVGQKIVINYGEMRIEKIGMLSDHDVVGLQMFLENLDSED